MKNTLLILSFSILSACAGKEQSKDHTISGIIENGAGKELILEHLTPQKVYPVDSAVIEEDGFFAFDYPVEEIGFFRVKKDDRSFITLIVQPGEKVVMNTKMELGMNPYTVEGSPESENLKGINMKLNMFFGKRDSLSAVFKSNEGNTEILTQLQDEYKAMVEDNMRYMRNFVKMNPASFACLAAAEQLNPDEDLELFKLIDSEMGKKYPKSNYYTEFHKVVESMSKLAIGTEAPDILLPDASGKMVSLSSLRGHVVLVDFWASWCKPCRMENPNVVSAYKKFNSKGFEIYGVSLDQDRNAWMQAIEADGLHWTQVSDLKFWNSAVVKLYDIKGIPFALLLDKDGVIIGKNLRGRALHDKLEEILD